MVSKPRKRIARAVGPEQRKARASAFVDAARTLYDAAGFDGFTVQAVTQAAGTAKGTFYLYFASKDALVAHMHDMEEREAWRVFAATFVLMPFPADPETVAAGVVRALGSRPRLAALRRDVTCRVLPGLDETAAVDHQQRTNERRSEPASLLAGLLPGVDRDRALAVLRWVDALATTLTDDDLERAIVTVLSGAPESGTGRAASSGAKRGAHARPR